MTLRGMENPVNDYPRRIDRIGRMHLHPSPPGGMIHGGRGCRDADRGEPLSAGKILSATGPGGRRVSGGQHAAAGRPSPGCRARPVCRAGAGAGRRRFASRRVDEPVKRDVLASRGRSGTRRHVKRPAWTSIGEFDWNGRKAAIRCCNRRESATRRRVTAVR